MSRTSRKKSQPVYNIFPDAHDILMNAPIGVFTSTPDGRYISANPALAAMYGYDSPEGLIESVTDIAEQVYVDPSDREDFIRLMKEKGEVVNHESRRLRRDGTVFWVSMNAGAVRDEEGRIIACQGFTTDITERKITEEKASKSKQTLVTILERLPADVYVSDIQDHTVLYMNKSMRQSFGRDCTGELCYEVFNNASSPCSQCKKPSLLDDQHRPTGIISWEWYNPVVKKWYKNEDQAIPWDGGKFVHIQLATDITERKLVEEELKEKTVLLEAILDNTPDIMSVKRPDLSVVRYNKAGYAFLNKHHDQIHGSKCYEIIGRGTPCQPCATQKAINTKQPAALEKYSPELNMHLDCRTNPILADDGQVKYTVELIRDITARKMAEEALRESEEKHRALIDGLPDTVMRFDREGRHLFVSDNIREEAGIEPEWFIGKTHEELDFPEDLTRFWEESILWVFENGKPLKNEFMVELKTGTTIFDWRLVPEKDAQGAVSSVLTISRDITERKQTEQELRLQSLVLDQIQDLLTITDLSGKITYVNQAAIKSLGFTQEEILDQATELYGDDPQRGATQQEILEKTLQEGFWRGEVVNYAKDGGERILDCRTQVVRNEKGQPVALCGISTDITQRKRAEDMLRHSYDLLQYIVEHMRSAVAVHDRNLNYIYVSQQYLREYKVKEKDIIGKHHYEVFPDLPQKWRDAHQKALAGEVLSAEEDPYFREDGSVEWTRWECRPWYDQDGTVGGIIVYTEVITERKWAEEEREKLQSQLLQAQKMESVGMLAGGVAHDFNNLLHAMGGNLELLDIKLPDDHPGKKRVKIIQKSMDRAAHLVRQMLLFSRKAAIQRQSLDLNQEIRDVRNILERSIPKMVNIELILDDNAWPINADPVQVEQVLLNLGANAADAMPDGGRLIIETKNITLDQVFIRNHTGAKPGKYVLMTVSDTGCGMDKEALQHVFDPFFTTKEVGKGTGLGLASVYGIVKAHDGYIYCYSEPGKGSTFKLYWPADPEINAFEDETALSAIPEGGSETILVVEDEEDIRELTVEALEGHGYQTLSAVSGEQALEIYSDQGQSVDLIILDLNMPGMGGHKCLREILNINPEARVLIASGYSANGQAKDIQDSGVTGFIGKPFQTHKLLAKIREVLDV